VQLDRGEPVAPPAGWIDDEAKMALDDACTRERRRR
jgi:hypothetical protein